MITGTRKTAVLAKRHAKNSLLDSLAAYWPSNEASGNLLDAHVYGKDGADANTVTSSTGLVYPTARQHTKANNEYFLSNNATFNADADWSFATWVRHDDISQQTIYQSTGNAGQLAQVMLDTYSAGKYTFIMFTSAGANTQVHATTCGNAPAETWLSLVVTYTASSRSMTISVNGGARNTGTLGAAPRISASSLAMTLGFSAGRGLNGRMGPSAFWDRVLTPEEEALWYSGGGGLAYSQLSYSSPLTVDVFIIAGQSNASGRGTNSQVWSHASLIPLLYGNDYRWKRLVDPTDSVTDQVDSVSNENPTLVGGSCWPLLATQVMARTGRPCVFVPCAKGGSAITAWVPGADHLDRTTLYGSMNYRINQVRSLHDTSVSLRGVLWWQGEQDATNGMDAATYNGHLDTIANAISEDQRLKLMPCKLQNSSGIADAAELEINTAIGDAWADNANVLAGPDFTDIASDDTAHLQSDAKLLTAATRWYDALVAAELI